MSNDLNSEIILSAISLAGPEPTPPVKRLPVEGEDPSIAADEYDKAYAAYTKELTAHDQRIKSAARRIKVMTSPESRIYKQLTAIDKAIDKDSDAGKVFVGTVCSVVKEASSQRAIVTLYTGTQQQVNGQPLGYETVRTDRTDNADGRAIAREAQLLVGHRVTVYVEIEAIRGGSTKVRVLRHLDSNGVDANYDPATKTVRAQAAAAA